MNESQTSSNSTRNKRTRARRTPRMQQNAFDWGLETPKDLVFTEYECRLVRVAGGRLKRMATRRRGLVTPESPDVALQVCDSDGVIPHFYGTRQIGDYCVERFGSLITEGTWVVALRGVSSPLAIVQVAHGSYNTTVLTPLDVLRPVIASGASNFLLVHNHPSGMARPSSIDVRTTVALRAAAGIVGVDLLDHLVVAERTWCSIRERYPEHWDSARRPTLSSLAQRSLTEDP